MDRLQGQLAAPKQGRMAATETFGATPMEQNAERPFDSRAWENDRFDRYQL